MRARIAPGVTENELWGGFMGDALNAGAEYCETRLLCSGPHTNPWIQEASDRRVREGDLAGLTTDGAHEVISNASHDERLLG